MSEWSARNFMRVADKFKTGNVPDLGPSALYDLTAPNTPPEVQVKDERRIAAGDLVNAADIRALKNEAKRAAQRVGDLEHKADALEDLNRDLVANA